MIERPEKFPSSEHEIREHVALEYLRLGSVSKVLQYNEDIPYSESSIHRIVDEFGIVKFSGRHSAPMGDTLAFLQQYSIDTRGVERVVERTLPWNLQTSDTTFYRVIKHIKKGVVRRNAAALVITPENGNNYVLVADDSTSLDKNSKSSVLTLPSSFVGPKETDRNIVIGILQREVFANLTLAKTFPYEIVDSASQFMELTIGDISLGVYHLPIASSYLTIGSLSSPKLANHRFITPQQVFSGIHTNLRLGSLEVAEGYVEYLQSGAFISRKANINRAIILNRGFDQTISPS